MAATPSPASNRRSAAPTRSCATRARSPIRTRRSGTAPAIRKGLSGEQIPLAARLMAVADVYDALISKRVYKPAFTHETAVELIRQGRGEHFDPDIVDAMLVIEEQFRAIAAEFPDSE